MLDQRALHDKRIALLCRDDEVAVRRASDLYAVRIDGQAPHQVLVKACRSAQRFHEQVTVLKILSKHHVDTSKFILAVIHRVLGRRPTLGVPAGNDDATAADERAAGQAQPVNEVGEMALHGRASRHGTNLLQDMPAAEYAHLLTSWRGRHQEPIQRDP